MVAVGTCVAALFVAVVAVPGARERRSYVEEYLVDTVEDASIAGDNVGVVGVDCSDDDSSESIEVAYAIINKREIADDQLPRSSANISFVTSPATSLLLPNIQSKE